MNEQIQRLCKLRNRLFIPDASFKFISYQSNGQELVVERIYDAKGGSTEIAHLLLSAKRTAATLKRQARILTKKDGTNI